MHGSITHVYYRNRLMDFTKLGRDEVLMAVHWKKYGEAI